MALVSKCDTTNILNFFSFFLRKRPLHSSKSNPANMWPRMCLGAELCVMTHMCEKGKSNHGELNEQALGGLTFEPNQRLV